MSFTETLQGLTGKPLADCTNQELYLALLELVRQKSEMTYIPMMIRNASAMYLNRFSFRSLRTLFLKTFCILQILQF